MSIAAVRSRPLLAPLHPLPRSSQSTLNTASLTSNDKQHSKRLSKRSISASPMRGPTDHSSSKEAPPWNAARRVHLYIDVRVRGRLQPNLVQHMLTYVLAYDRTFLFRCYRRSFLGSDAVAFFVKAGYARTVEEALALGNSLMRAGLFRQVKNQYLFRNGNYFYRFAHHEDYCRDDEEGVTMRSSRMMSVACNSFLGACPVKRLDKGSAISDVTASDADSDNEHSNKPLPSFNESHVKVEIGIRIGSRTFSNLVSQLMKAPKLVGTNYYQGKKYPTSFLGSEAVQWLNEKGYARNIKEGVKIGNALLNSGVLHPLASEEGFDCNSLPYRFMADVDITKSLRKGAVKDKILKYLMGINRDSKKALHISPWFEQTLTNISQDKKVECQRKKKALIKNNRVDLLPDVNAKPVELPKIDTMINQTHISNVTVEEDNLQSSAITVYSREDSLPAAEALGLK